VNDATACLFVTNISGGQTFWVKVSTVETETIHVINVNNKTVL